MRNTVRFFCLLLLILAGASFAEVTQGPAKLHATAPRFSYPDQNGKTISLEQFTGKFLVIQFMSSDCYYDTRHFKARTFQTIYEKYKEKNVAWVAINSNRGANPDRDRAWAAEYGVGYPIIHDGTLELAKAYGVTKTPTIMIVGRDGNIVYIGAVDDDDRRDGGDKNGLRNYIDRALGELTSGNPVSIPETKPYGCDLNKVE